MLFVTKDNIKIAQNQFNGYKIKLNNTPVFAKHPTSHETYPIPHGPDAYE